MEFAVGSLVSARGREWVVLPDSTDDLLVVRPLGGTDEEVTGIYLPIEPVKPANFRLPGPNHPGDFLSARLLRDAVRFGFRSSAGPFRSFARLGVEPRPYQLVPLLMALRLDPVRLLIADDVGIGKTVEAGLIARELMDRGEVKRLAVLCPPHLAEQWQVQLREKFHIAAELVLPSTARKLERVCRIGESLFDYYPHVIVSLDFIKSDKYREEFVRTCPEMVIVDEAHTCAAGVDGSRKRHQRHELLRLLSAESSRHLILVTATPHSGKEESFRSLLALLDPKFASIPQDLEREERKAWRQELARHLVQRRRGDIERFLDNTVFPVRKDREATYTLSPEYRRLLDRALAYARESVKKPGEAGHKQRVRWWAALGLLRSLASSPAAAAATLRARAAVADTVSLEDADELGRRTVFDLDTDESFDVQDASPGADIALAEDGPEPVSRRRLREMAREADAFRGDKDAKLVKASAMIGQLVHEGFSPIVFCRFIPTAEYVAEELRRLLNQGDTNDIEVLAVTGLLPPAEREERILALAKARRRVLVATDCISEGIDIQEHFDAVFHYDLPWNPTRLEQREGRVDRYGQPQPNGEVRVVTYYGTNNYIDGIILDVLLRKHKNIRSDLGVSVPVPTNSNDVVEAIFEGLLLRESQASIDAEQMALFEDLVVRSTRDKLFAEWEAASDREKRSRTLFAQETIKPAEVAAELAVVRESIGTASDVATFVRDAVIAHRGTAVEANGRLVLDLAGAPRALRDAVGVDDLTARFERPVQKGEAYLSRTHPFVEGLASYVLDTALDERAPGVARRAGVIRTTGVQRRTTLLLVRSRFHIYTRRSGQGEDALLAEDLLLLAFAGSPRNATWLTEDEAKELLALTPSGNVAPEQATNFLRPIIDGYALLEPAISEAVRSRGRDILDAHSRVRRAARITGFSYRVEPQLPADLLGIYVYLPVAE